MRQRLKHSGAKSIPIQKHVANYRSRHLALPKWQRNGQKIWEGEYKSDLIESIMYGIDIPKIYLGTLKGKPERLIIDGGHRTRCLDSYMNNKFPWKESGTGALVYYSECPHETRNNRVMTNVEKSWFDNYELTVLCYEGVTEKEARMIFNRLQNAAPMAMADIVNSYESDLVEFFRDEVRPWLLKGNDEYKHLKGCPLKKPDTNEDIYQLLSWYTIINPVEHNDKSPEENALENIEMGKGREGNKCFGFLKNFDDTTLTQAKMTKFKENITVLTDFLKDNQKFNNAEISSFLYARLYVPNFSQDKFVEFMEKVKLYKALDSESNKKFKLGQTALAQAKKTERDELDTEYGGCIEKWQKSKQQNGMRDANMDTRNEVLKTHCVDDGVAEVEPFVEGDALEQFVTPPQ
jgi:hypothetical protein